MRAVVLVRDAEDAVIDEAPDRGERIAPAEVDAADAPGHRSRLGELVANARLEVGIHLAFQRREAAVVFLLDPRRPESARLLRDELRRYPRAHRPRHMNAMPRPDADPLRVKPAALAERRRQGDEQPAMTDGEHRPNRAIKIVRHPRRLIKDEETNAGVGANRLLTPRQRDEPGTVGELEFRLRRAHLADRRSDGAIGGEGLAEELATLPFGRSDKEHERTRLGDQLMDRKSGDRRRLAGLTGTVEENGRVVTEEEVALPEVGRHSLLTQDARRIEDQR